MTDYTDPPGRIGRTSRLDNEVERLRRSPTPTPSPFAVAPGNFVATQGAGSGAPACICIRIYRGGNCYLLYRVELISR